MNVTAGQIHAGDFLIRNDVRLQVTETGQMGDGTISVQSACGVRLVMASTTPVTLARPEADETITVRMVAADAAMFGRPEFVAAGQLALL